MGPVAPLTCCLPPCCGRSRASVPRATRYLLRRHVAMQSRICDRFPTICKREHGVSGERERERELLPATLTSMGNDWKFAAHALTSLGFAGRWNRSRPVYGAERERVSPGTRRAW